MIFSGLNDLPVNFSVYLIDINREKAINLKEDTNYNFIPVREKLKFRIVIGKASEIKNIISTVNKPTGYSLGKNYPNPFNPTTNIPVMLEKESDIRLAIYNLIGEEVRVIYSGILPDGTYTFEWDGRNENRHMMTSGIYICRLRTKAGIDLSNKMILLK